MLTSARRIIIKIGSSLIIGDGGVVRTDWLSTLAADIANLKKNGKEIIVLTSGAVGLGRQVMGYGSRVLELEEKQAAAACGQLPLFMHWSKALEANELAPAQILLTADDSINRRRYLNARNTLETLLENQHIVPIINENDTVATAELRFGDNDRLAARVAQMSGADLLILFSDIDGLYSADPRIDKNARFIEQITDITPDIEAMAGGAASTVSNGGMITKIVAAKIATNAGCSMMIAKGTEHNPLKKLANGGKATIFIAKENPLSARKHWIAGSMHPAGNIIIDAGAELALHGGKSLLPAGVKTISGTFERGDAVVIMNSEGKQIGRGLISYNAVDAKKIIGKKSAEIEQILGFKRRDVLIHRDDMVLE